MGCPGTLAVPGHVVNRDELRLLHPDADWAAHACTAESTVPAWVLVQILLVVEGWSSVGTMS